MCACVEPVGTAIGAVCVESGGRKWMLNHAHIHIYIVQKNNFFFFWHPMLVRPSMKRLFFPWKIKEKKAGFARAPHDKSSDSAGSDALCLEGLKNLG